MRDAAFMEFDIILMVSASQHETNAFKKLHTLPLRVSIANTWPLLKRNDSPYLERWKTQAFFGTLVKPKRYDWYVMLDDDTLPNLASLTRILCLLHGGDRDSFATRRAFGRRRNATGGLYMGWTPKGDEGYVFATGEGFLMDQEGVRALKHRMLGLSRVESRESCHSQVALARMPRCWWRAHKTLILTIKTPIPFNPCSRYRVCPGGGRLAAPLTTASYGVLTTSSVPALQRQT